MQGFVISLNRQYAQELAIRCENIAEAEAVASKLSEGASPDDLGVSVMLVNSQLSSSFNVRQIFDTEVREIENVDTPPTEL